MIVSLQTFAQTVPLRQKLDSIFQYVDKTQIPTGYLKEYGAELMPIHWFNGVLTDSNKVNAGLLNDIYTTVAMSAIHTNAGGFNSPAYVDSLWQLQRQPGIVTLVLQEFLTCKTLPLSCW